MTEIAVHRPTAVATPDQSAQPGTDLILWARQAEAAAIYAERVCSTTMAPAAYRGKPAEAAAAILAGAELGFSPMASLRAFHNIQGTPAPAALTLRAVVQAAGHEIRTVESTAERAVVDGRRKGDAEWQTSIWDIKRAMQLAQYKTNPNYKTNPAQMLVARATAEVCRWIASDAIMGMPYAAEEVGDFEPAVQAPTVRRLSVADLDRPALTREQIIAAAATPEDRAYAENFDRPERFNGPDEAEPIGDDQRKRMFALWGELGYSNSEEDRGKRLWLTAQILGLDTALESSSDLTRTEADTVIAALIERKAQQQPAGPQ